MAKQKPPGNQPPEPDKPQGDDQNNELTARVRDLRPLLNKFGLKPPNSVINGWNTSQIANVERTLRHWQEEYDFAQAGKAQSKDDRWPMPEILKPFDDPDAGQLTGSQAMGKHGAEHGRDIQTCPYPAEGKLAEMWRVGHALGQPAAAASDKTTPETVVNPAEVIHLTPPKSTNPSPGDRAAEKARRIKEFLESRRDEALRVNAELDQAEWTWNEAKRTVSAAKGRCDELMMRLRSLNRDITRIQNGTYEYQESFFPPEDKKSKGAIPADQLPETDTPDLPPVDEGANFDLMTLKKGTLQKTTGCDSELGLSPTQIDKLKEAVGGSTIAALEKFQREHSHWSKEIKGFGDAAIDKLQDAMVAFRTKFPMPLATTSRPATSKPSPVPAKTDEKKPAAKKKDTKPPGKMSQDEAIQALQVITQRASETLALITHEDGKRFCSDVSKCAFDVLQKLKDQQRDPTDEEAQAIRNWRSGIDAWHSKTAASGSFGEGLDQPPEPPPPPAKQE